MVCMKTGLLTLCFLLSFSTYAQSVFLKVTPGQVVGFDYYPEEKSNVQAAFDLIEKIINSEEFKEKVLAYPDGKSQFTSNKGMTNEQIYDYFMQGKELIGGEQTLGEMNFDLVRYYNGHSKVKGFTNMGQDNWIHANGRFYADFSAAEIAGNIMHEWLHLNGFEHASAQDHDSVPYAVGYIMRDMAKKYLQEGHLD